MNYHKIFVHMAYIPPPFRQGMPFYALFNQINVWVIIPLVILIYLFLCAMPNMHLTQNRAGVRPCPNAFQVIADALFRSKTPSDICNPRQRNHPQEDPDPGELIQYEESQPVCAGRIDCGAECVSVKAHCRQTELSGTVPVRAHCRRFPSHDGNPWSDNRQENQECEQEVVTDEGRQNCMITQALGGPFKRNSPNVRNTRSRSRRRY